MASRSSWVPTWCPFGVQAYFNGHNVLAAKLRKAGIEYQMLDNAFTSMADSGGASRPAKIELESGAVQRARPVQRPGGRDHGT